MKNKQITMLARQLLFFPRSPLFFLYLREEFSRTTTQRYCHLSFDSIAVLEIVSVSVYSCDNAEYKLNFILCENFMAVARVGC